MREYSDFIFMLPHHPIKTRTRTRIGGVSFSKFTFTSLRKGLSTHTPITKHKKIISQNLCDATSWILLVNKGFVLNNQNKNINPNIYIGTSTTNHDIFCLKLGSSFLLNSTEIFST